MDRKRIKLSPEEDSQSSDSLMNAMPGEILLKIFRHLTQNELAQMSRVCKRWNEWTQFHTFWENKIDVTFGYSRCQTEVVSNFLERLTTDVTCFRLGFGSYCSWEQQDKLNFQEFCSLLSKKFPQLKALYLNYAEISVNRPLAIALCSKFLPSLKTLVFYNCSFSYCGERPTQEEYCDISGVEVLNLGRTLAYYEPPLRNMPHLKKLHMDKYERFEDNQTLFPQLQLLNMENGSLGLYTFKEIQRYGYNLTELYMCNTSLSDEHLKLRYPVFPRLKLICINECRLTVRGIIYLLQSCLSLQCVYIDRKTAELYAGNPFVAAKRYKLDIVIPVDVPFCNHFKKMDLFA